MEKYTQTLQSPWLVQFDRQGKFHVPECVEKWLWQMLTLYMLQDSGLLWLSAVTPGVQLISGQIPVYKPHQHHCCPLFCNINTTMSLLLLTYSFGQVYILKNCTSFIFRNCPWNNGCEMDGMLVHCRAHTFTNSLTLRGILEQPVNWPAGSWEKTRESSHSPCLLC